jgi:hypothetical protein
MSIWRPPAPCKPGDDITAIDTPALVVDMEKVDKNLKQMPKYMQAFPGVSYRPHAKAHKCPNMAKLQVGLTGDLNNFCLLQVYTLTLLAEIGKTACGRPS